MATTMKKLLVALTGVLLLLIAACAPADGPDQEAAPDVTDEETPDTTDDEVTEECDELTPAIVRLNWVVHYEQAAFYAAQEHGWYEEECVDIQIEPGQGSSDTVTVTAAGSAHLGVADTLAIMQGQAQDMPIVGVAIKAQENPFAIIVRDDSVDTDDLEPTDLYGLTFGAVHAGSPYINWQALVNQYDLDTDQIEEVAISPPGDAEFHQGAVDFLAQFSTAYPRLDAGTPALMLRGADLGQEAYGLGIVANRDWMEQNPDAVRGFLAATARGMRWSAQNPRDAIEILGQENEALIEDEESIELQMEMFDQMAALWSTSADATDATDLFTFDTAGLTQTQDLLYDAGVLEGDRFDLGEYWTDEFVPSADAYELD